MDGIVYFPHKLAKVFLSLGSGFSLTSLAAALAIAALVPALWELHKVHHSANVLTPLTVFRIHPLDGLIFSNILAVSLSVTNGAANYLFGKPITLISIDDTNVILVLFVHIYVHLQHTHL